MTIVDDIGDYKLKINDSMGRIVFGNTVRFSDNIRGKINQKTQRLKSPLECDSPSEWNLEKLKRTGFLNINQPFPEELVTEAKEAFENAIENESISAVRGNGKCNGKVYSKYIKNPEENTPIFYDFLTENVIQMVGAYLGSTFKLEEKNDNSYVVAYQNFHHPDHATDVPLIEKLGSGNWHCDRSQPDRIKLFVLLSDVDGNCGPFHIIPRSETKWMTKKLGFADHRRETMGAPGGYVDDWAKDIEKLTGPSGTAAFANTVDCMHRAGHPEEGCHRNLLVFEFKASSTHITEQLPDLL